MQMISYLGGASGAGVASPQVVSSAFPLPVALSGGLGGLAVAGTLAVGAAAAGQFPVTVGGVDGGGFVRQLLTDAMGVLQVNATIGGGGSITVVQPAAANLNATVTQGPGNTANAWTVGGPVASGVAVAGNPVPVGARAAVSTVTTVADGQAALLAADSHGNARSYSLGSFSASSDAISTNVITFGRVDSAAAAAAPLTTLGYLYNGATLDRIAKPRTAFRLPSSAASNNAANIKTTPGSILGPITGNVTLAASTCYLKFFDTTGTPNPAAQNPLYMFACNVVNGAFVIPCPAGGLYFPTGIGVAIVANPADLDNTAIAAGQVTALNVPYQ